MVESLQNKNIDIHNSIDNKSWIKEQIVKVYEQSNSDLNNLKDKIFSSIENELTMDHVIHVLESAKWRFEKWESYNQVINDMWSWLTITVQIALKSLWYDLWNIDGMYMNKSDKESKTYSNSKTRTAVKAFQEKWNKDNPKDLIKNDWWAGKETITRILKKLWATVGTNFLIQNNETSPIDNKIGTMIANLKNIGNRNTKGIATVGANSWAQNNETSPIDTKIGTTVNNLKNIGKSDSNENTKTTTVPTKREKNQSIEKKIPEKWNEKKIDITTKEKKLNEAELLELLRNKFVFVWNENKPLILSSVKYEKDTIIANITVADTIIVPIIFDKEYNNPQSDSKEYIVHKSRNLVEWKQKINVIRNSVDVIQNFLSYRDNLLFKEETFGWDFDFENSNKVKIIYTINWEEISIDFDNFSQLLPDQEVEIEWKKYLVSVNDLKKVLLTEKISTTDNAIIEWGLSWGIDYATKNIEETSASDPAVDVTPIVTDSISQKNASVDTIKTAEQNGEKINKLVWESTNIDKNDSNLNSNLSIQNTSFLETLSQEDKENFTKITKKLSEKEKTSLTALINEFYTLWFTAKLDYSKKIIVLEWIKGILSTEYIKTIRKTEDYKQLLSPLNKKVLFKPTFINWSSKKIIIDLK